MPEFTLKLLSATTHQAADMFRFTVLFLTDPQGFANQTCHPSQKFLLDT